MSRQKDRNTYLIHKRQRQSDVHVLSKTVFEVRLHGSVAANLKGCTHLLFVCDELSVYLLGLNRKVGKASPIRWTSNGKIAPSCYPSMREVLSPKIAEWAARMHDVSSSPIMRREVADITKWSDEEMSAVVKILIAENPS